MGNLLFVALFVVVGSVIGILIGFVNVLLDKLQERRVK